MANFDLQPGIQFDNDLVMGRKCPDGTPCYSEITCNLSEGQKCQSMGGVEGSDLETLADLPLCLGTQAVSASTEGIA